SHGDRWGRLMEWLAFREPVSAWTHAVWLLLAPPATLLLVRRSGADRLKQFAFVLFGLTLAACALGSTLYHSVRLPPEQIAWFATLDYIGIYLLIAGSITPPALIVLRGPWRWGMLVLAWGLAASGIVLRLAFTWIPPLLSVGQYFVMGWGVLVCYFELA